MVNQINPDYLAEYLHLWRLSHAIFTSSFELSAYFMSRFHTRIRQNEIILSGTPITSVCLSCSILQIPGWTCSVHLKRSSIKRYWRQKKTIRVKQAPPKPNCWVQYQCRFCGRIIRFNHEKQMVSRMQHTDAMDVSFSSASQSSETRTKQNIASRKRKKLRSEGLQGILDRMAREETLEKEKELSLEDFML
ncbi:hypothetical protein PCANB_002650 [Pneumocystis canis]|nr:hypothetical protein PCK1_002702 [Pneumocystis canis]KAG5438546.1 hypothetical protein PCANB_002650 [Pneumocystis canis]